MSSSSLRSSAESSESSVSLVLSSTSSESGLLSTEDNEAAEVVTMPADPMFYIVLIPRYGLHEVMGYSSSKAMALELTAWLEKKQQKLYDGEILVFQGRVIEYSDPVMNFRLNVPDKGEMSISGGSKGKYTQFTPKEFL